MDQLRCRYENTTDRFQIVVFTGLERVLLPGMVMEFNALLEDTITVKDGHITAITSDNIPCRQLLIK